YEHSSRRPLPGTGNQRSHILAITACPARASSPATPASPRVVSTRKKRVSRLTMRRHLALRVLVVGAGAFSPRVTKRKRDTARLTGNALYSGGRRRFESVRGRGLERGDEV